MRSRSTTYVLLSFAILGLSTFIVPAATPTTTREHIESDDADTAKFLEDAAKFRAQVERIARERNGSKPLAGTVAPPFTLGDQNGKIHRLSDYKGKWVVVYFYPKDQTPGCTSQACSFTENVFAFRKANAQILGISADDAASHKAFEKALSNNAKISAESQKSIVEHGLPFPLLADPGLATVKSYGVATQRTPGGPVTASRDTFLIDPFGKVAKRYDVTPDRLLNHSAELLADIEKFKAGKKN